MWLLLDSGRSLGLLAALLLALGVTAGAGVLGAGAEDVAATFCKLDAPPDPAVTSNQRSYAPCSLSCLGPHWAGLMPVAIVG
jgi:hypothetical protein